MIKIIKYSNNSEFVSKLRQEVFTFGYNSALDSGLFDTLAEAQQFAKQVIIDAFENAPNKQHCFEICSDNNMVGCAWLRDKHSPETQGEIRLSYIRIDPTYRRQGIASRSIKLLEEYAIKLGFTNMSLNVFSSLCHAKNLYERLGFKIVHETDKHGKIVTIEMVKLLAKQNAPSTNN